MPAPHHSVFYRPDALPDAQQTVSKHRKHSIGYTESSVNYTDTCTMWPTICNSSATNLPSECLRKLFPDKITHKRKAPPYAMKHLRDFVCLFENFQQIFCVI